MQSGDINRVKQVQSGRLAGLDLLRVIAAGFVLLFHFTYAGTLRAGTGIDLPLLAGIAKYGFLGVDLFFLISGFVIAASSENRTALQFAGARFRRLYPAHVACMTLTAMALVIAGNAPSLRQFGANLTMLAPLFGERFMDGVYWSIVLEILFYGWVAVLVATGLWRRRLLAIVAVWLMIALANEATLQWRPARLVLLTEYAGLFAGGIILQRMWRGDRNLPSFVLLGLAIALGLIHATEHQRVIERLYGDVIPLWTLMAAHLAIYGIFLIALKLSSSLSLLPHITTLGGITYPLYLIHQDMGYLLLRALAPALGDIAALGVTTAIVFAIAWAVYAWVEPVGRHAIRSMHSRAANSATPLKSPNRAASQSIG